MAYGIKINLDYTTGANLFARAQQTSDTAVTNTWDEANSVWAASPSAGDEKIALTEDGSLGVYRGYTVKMGTFTGDIFVTVHDDDDANDKAIASAATRLVDGVDLETGAVSSILVSTGRTWRLQSTRDGSEAGNIIGVDSGTVATLAMQFGANKNWPGVLNPGTGLSTVSSVTMTGTSLTTANLAVSQDRAHAHVQFTCDSTGERKVTITCTTTDGETVKGQGWLHVV